MGPLHACRPSASVGGNWGRCTSRSLCSPQRYAFVLLFSSTYALTVSNAVALFEKRCEPKCDSSSLSNAAHSASLVHAKATPCSLFGVSVGVARKSEQLIPRSPGNIFHTS